jgi:hypothetical protein
MPTWTIHERSRRLGSAPLTPGGGAPSFTAGDQASGVINDGVNVQWYVNNVASGAAGTSQGLANSPTSNVGILCWIGNASPSSPASFFCGYSDFVLTKTALGSTDRASLDQYFHDTWGF